MTSTGVSGATGPGGPAPATGLAGLLLAIRQQWIAFLIGALLILLPAGFLIATQKAEYQSEAVVGLVPIRPMSDSFLSTVASQLPVYLQSPEVTNRIGQKAGMTGKEVERAVSIEIPDSTLNLTATATADDPQTAALLANETANETLRNKEYAEFFKPQILSPAVPPERAAGLGRSVLLAAALLVAVVVGCVAALLARDLRAGSADSGAPAGPPAGDRPDSPVAGDLA